MSDFKDYLKEGEDLMGVPGLTDYYNKFDDEVKELIDDIWPILFKNSLKVLANELGIELLFKDKNVQLLYLALKAKFNELLSVYPDRSCIMIGKSLVEVSDFLAEHDQKLDFVNFVSNINSIDVFLYLDVYIIKGCSGNSMKVPFYAGFIYKESENNDFIIKNYKNFKVIELSSAALEKELGNGLINIDKLIDEHIKSLDEFNDDVEF